MYTILELYIMLIRFVYNFRDIHAVHTVYAYSTYVHNIPSENCVLCRKTQKAFTMCNPKMFILCKTIPVPAHSCTSH